MGVWFLSSFIGNFASGKLAMLAEPIGKGDIKLPWPRLGGQADYFVMFMVVPLAAGIVILLATPWLKKLLRNPND